MTPDPDLPLAFSLVRGGALYRLQQRIRLTSDSDLGTRRRILLLGGIAWLPIALAALASGRLIGPTDAGLLGHYGVQARCLVAIPLFLIAERSAESLIPRLLGYFVTSGLVRPADAVAFRAALAAAERSRDSIWGTLFVLGVVAAALLGAASGATLHDVAWTETGAGSEPALEFARNWYLLAVRPLFAALAGQWLWRVGVMFRLFNRIAQLDLQLVANHPDRAAGLGFIDQLPVTFIPIVFGFSSVIAAGFAHEMVHHGESLARLQPVVAFWALFAIGLFLLPVSPLVRKLAGLRRAELLRYGALVSRHGRLFEQRWLAGPAESDEALLSAPEISAAADVNAIYQAVSALRPLPITLRDVIPYAAAALLPFLPVVAIEIPLKQLVLRVLSALA